MSTVPTFIPCQPWRGYIISPSSGGAVEVFGENRCGDTIWTYAARRRDGRTAAVSPHLIERAAALHIPAPPRPWASVARS